MRFRTAVLAAALAGGGLQDAQAAALRVSPVGFEFQPGQRAATLSVRDDGDGAMNVQARVFRWTQQGGADRLGPTDDLLTSPPFAALDPGAEQTIRLVRAATPDPAQAAEQAFRVLVDELPPTGPGTGTTVRLLMRHSVPVFLAPPVPVRADLSWSARAGTSSIRLAAENKGGRHVRLANLRVTDAGGRVLGEQGGLVGYVLAGSAMSFDIPRVAAAAGAPSATPAHVLADTDSGRIDAAVGPGA